MLPRTVTDKDPDDAPIQSKYGLIAARTVIALQDRRRVIVNAQGFRAAPRCHDRKSLDFELNLPSKRVPWFESNQFNYLTRS